MGKIVILDENTANKIAAGEVVERPASVIKELVENSIDAKSTAINIEIRNGGISYIKVSDNGSGIDDDDVELAFERHATSKIRSAEELESIFTMGFRGEALASIASVARVELMTRPQNKDNGSYIKVEGGRVVDFKQVGSPLGTTFTVRDLFYNTPARYKFLKRDTQEAAYVSDVLERIAISRPDISISLKVNNNSVLYTPGNNDLLSVIYSIYGKAVAQSIVPISYGDDKVTVNGFVGKPELSRGTRREQSVFVNGRYIKSKLITSAIDQAYKTSLMKGRYAFSIINININPMLVDVNVHPTKMEVRFSDEQLIFRAVYNAIQDALFSRNVVPTVNIAAKSQDGFTIKTEKPNYTQQHIEIKKPVSNEDAINIKEFTNILVEGREKLKEMTAAKENNNVYTSTNTAINENTAEPQKNANEFISSKEMTKEEIKEEAPNLTPTADVKAEPVNEVNTEVHTEIKSDMKTDISSEENSDKVNKEANLGLKDALIIGQAFNTYIILQKGDEIFWVDQHAAHERVIYESIKDKYKSSSSPTQMLAAPQVVEITASEFRLAIENIKFFEKLGFIFEGFGNNSLIVRSVPAVLTDTNFIQSFKDILDSVVTSNNSDISLIADEAIYQIACKAAIKANKKLNEMETKELLKQMETLENPYTCPHGRPTVLRLTKYEVEKMFKRLGAG